MTDDKQLDHLIGLLYETVLDPSLWPEVVGLFGRYAGGIAGQLTTLNKADFNPTVFLIEGEVGQADAEIYQDSIPIDPRLIMFPDLTIQKWLCCHHYCDDDFANHNEFYQDLLIPNNIRYAILARVDDNADHCTILASIRGVGQQPFSETNNYAPSALAVIYSEPCAYKIIAKIYKPKPNWVPGQLTHWPCRC